MPKTMEKHPLAGQTVTLNCKPDPDNLNGQQFQVEDYWMNVAGKSCRTAMAILHA